VAGVDDVGVDDVGAGVAADAVVAGLLAPVLPPQATSVMRSNAAYACLIFSPPRVISYYLCNKSMLRKPSLFFEPVPHASRVWKPGVQPVN
jgi:hypothetical protein